MKGKIISRGIRVSFKQWLSIGLAIVIAMGTILASDRSAFAQFPIPGGLGQATGTRPPENVRRFGNIEVATLRSPIDRKELFEIASPTIYNRSAPDSTPVEAREAEIRAKLNRTFLRLIQDSNRDSLNIAVSKLNNVTVITATTEDYPRPLPLLSITNVDADFHGKPIEALATEWRSTLEAELEDIANRFSRTKIVQHIAQSIGLAIGLIALTGVYFLLRLRLGRYQQTLLARKAALQKPPEPEEAISTEGSPSLMADEGSPAETPEIPPIDVAELAEIEKRLARISSIQWVLFWTLITLWYCGVSAIFSWIPFLAGRRRDILSVPLDLLAIWFFVGLAIRFTYQTVDRIRERWEDVYVTDTNLRLGLRSSTVAGAAKGMLAVSIVAIGIFSALTVFGIPSSSILAVGGLLGLAVSFGSQSLVKDLVNGFLILAEDQFAVGDFIDVGQASGTVEELNLRVTQLRSSKGELITIPNSQIATVKNATRNWSRANFSIEVAYDTNPRQALSIMQEVSQALCDDPVWGEFILESPTVLGIDTVTHSGMTLTVWVQTIPGKQWAVGRELRLRVREALDKHDIQIGIPRRTYALDQIQATAQNENESMGLFGEG